MSALISRETSIVQKRKCEGLQDTIAKPIAYMTLFAAPYGHYTVELIDAFGVIWPIVLEVAFTATVVLLIDKILKIRGPLNIFRPPPPQDKTFALPLLSRLCIYFVHSYLN